MTSLNSPSVTDHDTDQPSTLSKTADVTSSPVLGDVSPLVSGNEVQSRLNQGVAVTVSQKKRERNLASGLRDGLSAFLM